MDRGKTNKPCQSQRKLKTKQLKIYFTNKGLSANKELQTT
jgi:hypothetical protein